MKIDKVIFTTSEEYSDFWNINSKVHKEYLGIEPICYLFGKKENTNMNEDFGPVYEISYDERFNWLLQLTWYKFWVAQYYPNDVIMIGDIDNIPLQRNWFIDDIEDYSDDCYVHLNAEGIGDQWVAKGGNLTGGTDLPGHYHVAKGTTYKKSLKLNSYFLDDIKKIINANKYGLGINQGGRFTGETYYWCAEENYSSELLFNSMINNEITFHGKSFHNHTKRIDRSRMRNGKYIYSETMLKTNQYIDIHCARPYKSQENALIEVLEKGNIL
jgi:hypothetical protein